MPISTVWKHAFRKLGASEETAENMIVLIKDMATSPQAFEDWDRSLNAGAERPIIAAIDSPGGENIASEILNQFRSNIKNHYKITESEVAAKLNSMGFN